MILRGTLVWRKGHVALRQETYRLPDEPLLRIDYFRGAYVGDRADAETLGHRFDRPMISFGEPGKWYSEENPGGLPYYFEREFWGPPEFKPVPPPKTSLQVRWKDGRWEKKHTRRGWIPA